MGGNKQKDTEMSLFDMVIFTVIFLTLMYFVFVPLWGFMGNIVKVLGGR